MQPKADTADREKKRGAESFFQDGQFLDFAPEQSG